VRLDVYVETGCRFCERAVEIAQEVDEAYPRMSVRVLDVAEAPGGDDVFAVPTFILNGDVISLGNPDRSELRRAIEGLLDPEVD